MSEIRPACAGKTDLFFSDNPRDRKLACSICQGCPLLEECRERVLTCPHLEYGIWAGWTESQRIRARRLAHGRQYVCGTYQGWLRHRRRSEEPCARCEAVQAHRQAAKRDRYRRLVAEGWCTACANGNHDLHSVRGSCSCPTCTKSGFGSCDPQNRRSEVAA